MKPTQENQPPFWKEKSLDEMNNQEWESLCDGCGRCCLVKVIDEDTDELYFTNVTCALFNPDTCRCSDYPNRTKRVEDCIQLTKENIQEINFLPPTCAYRLISEGKDLYWWHPLRSGTQKTVIEAGISVYKRTGPSETEVKLEDYEDHLVDWPKQGYQEKKSKI